MYSEHAKYIHHRMLPAAQLEVPVESLADFLHLVRVNAHNITISQPQPAREWRASAARIGLGMFFWLHLANHSCAPNAFFTATSARGRDGAAATATLYALRNIEEGE